MEVTRDYTGLVFTNLPSLKEDLHATYDFYLKGASTFEEFWLNFLAGTAPEFFTSDSTLSDYKLTVGVKEDGEPVKERADPALVLFSLWMSLEVLDSKNKTSQSLCTLIPDQVVPLFEKYLAGRLPISDNTRKILNLTAQAVDSDKVVWVDRRQEFYRMNSELQIPSEELHKLARSNCWPLTNDVVNTSRSLLSWWWGEKENGWSDVLKKLLSVKTAYESWDLNGNLIDHILTTTGLRNLGKTGRKSSVELFLKGKGSSKNDFAKILDDEITKVEKDINKTREPWMGRLKSWIERKVGIKYQQSGKSARLQNHFSEMCSMSLTRIRSSKTNFLNRLGERLHFLRELKKIPLNKETTLVDKTVRQWLITQDSKWVDGRALNGLDTVCHFWKSSTDWVSCVPRAQASLQDMGRRGGNKIVQHRFGDSTLFTALARSCSALPDVDWYKEIQYWMNRHCLERKLHTDFTIPYHRISEDSPQHPTFGSSRPKKENPELIFDPVVEVDKSYRDRRKRANALLKVKLQLFDKHGNLKMREVPFYSDRLFREVLCRNQSEGSVEVQRNHSLNREYLGVKNAQCCTPVAKIKGIKLQRLSEDFWKPKKEFRLHFSVEMEKVKQPDNSSLLTLGSRVIGFDLGERQPLAWSLWEVVENPPEASGDWYKEGETLYKRIDGYKDKQTSSIWVKLLEKGVWNPAVMNIGDDKPNDREIAVWDKLKQAGIIDNNVEVPKGITAFNAKLIYILKCHCKGVMSDATKKHPCLGGFSSEALIEIKAKLSLDILYEVWDLLFDCAYKGTKRRYLGGLSYSRILMFNQLKGVVQAYKSVYESGVLDRHLEVLRVKVNNLRRERLRLTNHEVLSLALEKKAKIIFMEDLTLDKSHESPKWRNKRLDLWCPKKIASEVVEQAKLFGLLVRKVNPCMTSNTDFLIDKYTVRLTKVRLNQLKYKPFSVYINSTLNPTPRALKSVRYLPYKAAWEQLAVELGLGGVGDLLSLDTEEMRYVPHHCGERIRITDGGLWDADIAASCNIAVKGLRSLLTYVKRGSEGQGDKKLGEYQKRRKSFVGKSIAEERHKKARSQNVRAREVRG